MGQRKGYYGWLMDMIGGPGEYSLVLKKLNEMEYTSPIAMDENRAEDGLLLRYYYKKETGKNCEKTGPCSILEMLIGLALRTENDFLFDPKVGNRVNQWFWDMFFTAGLGEFTDNGQKKWANAHFLDSKVGRDGRLKLFKMAKSPENFDKMEVWWQLCRYISEKY